MTLWRDETYDRDELQAMFDELAPALDAASEASNEDPVIDMNVRERGCTVVVSWKPGKLDVTMPGEGGKANLIAGYTNPWFVGQLLAQLLASSAPGSEPRP
jgi:hypothetical protein